MLSLRSSRALGAGRDRFRASVDDSAIYFVLHGARRFIAFGPLPNAANCAEENVNISGLAERIKIANAVPGGLAASGAV
jgi:hypothetical protein